jgi:hypothetical protein
MQPMRTGAPCAGPSSHQQWAAGGRRGGVGRGARGGYEGSRTTTSGRRWPRPPSAAPGDAGGSGTGGGSGSGSSSGRGKRLRGGRAREPGLFEIQDVSPPPRSLGVFALPPNTHTQDVIELRVDPSPSGAAAEDWQATMAAPASSSSSGGGGSGSGSGSGSEEDDRPPAEGRDGAVRSYVVVALVLQFKLVKGRYRRDHSRLEVQPVGRFLTNLALAASFQAKPYLKQRDGGGGGGGGDDKGGGGGGDDKGRRRRDGGGKQ